MVVVQEVGTGTVPALVVVPQVGRDSVRRNYLPQKKVPQVGMDSVCRNYLPQKKVPPSMVVGKMPPSMVVGGMGTAALESEPATLPVVGFGVDQLPEEGASYPQMRGFPSLRGRWSSTQ